MDTNKKIERMLLKLANHYMLSFRMYGNVGCLEKAKYYLQVSFKYAGLKGYNHEFFNC